MLKLLTSLISKKRHANTLEKRNGKWKEFNKQGILISEGNYKDDLRAGEWRFYYDTGELAITETYTAGQMEGAFKSYYKSGIIISEGQYLNNKREGEFYVFDESGRVVKMLHFKDDILVEEISVSGQFKKDLAPCHSIPNEHIA